MAGWCDQLRHCETATMEIPQGEDVVVVDVGVIGWPFWVLPCLVCRDDEHAVEVGVELLQVGGHGIGRSDLGEDLTIPSCFRVGDQLVESGAGRDLSIYKGTRLCSGDPADTDAGRDFSLVEGEHSTHDLTSARHVGVGWQ